ncbi:thymidine phosphorylase-like isoform X1 [Rhodnius prolixus]|uniref:Thymidine phosphorylase n=2 Tax=Rhodnius TaxID=13248 RepID=A0ABL0DJS6_RHOPR
MNIQQLLTKKRHAQELYDQEIEYFVKSACDGSLHASQIGAMLMAIAIQGLTNAETIALTKAMINSGKRLEWSGIVVDKHSTGGVGDKVSLPLAPALAACGLKVPMLSGRGLGLTGGTLDKLESIRGFAVDLSSEQMNECLSRAGCFIASPTSDICPGDKATYSYRDVTATVDCINLIVASILSKKIAEGCKYLVLDLKAGKAALYKTVAEAEELAKHMVDAAKDLGLKMKCVITSMDQPIGRTVGNAVEIEESVACLKGSGPADLVELVTHLGGELLVMCGKAISLEEGINKILNVLNNGEALKRFKEMCIAQGVSAEDALKLCNQQFDGILPKASFVTKFKVTKSGWVKFIDAQAIAEVCWELGSGRRKPTDKLDLSVGIKLLCSAGDQISAEDCWLELHHNLPVSDELARKLDKSIEVSPTKYCNVPSRIIKTVE